MNSIPTYTYKQVYDSTFEYFNGNKLLTDIWINKYTLKDKSGNYYELTPQERLLTITKEIVDVDKYLNQQEKEKFYKEVRELLTDFHYFIPGGSILYGVGNKQFLSSLGNCFVVGNKTDSYGSICMIDEEQVQLMKRRGGVGHDLSHLRPKGTSVNGCANSSTGSVSFAERYSNSTREVAQDGRRGALMLTHHINHPDIEDFITLKSNSTKVTGANISVKITNEFMNNVLNEQNHKFKFPIDSNNIVKEKSAKEIFNKLVQQSWRWAEPGVLFWDKIIEESPADCYSSFGFETKSTNPCFPGHMMIAVADGRKEVSIKQLTEEGGIVPVYTLDKENNLCIKEMGNFRKTGNHEIYEVLLDNGNIIECTGNHKFITKNRGKVEAKDLIKGDSLFTILRSTKERNFLFYQNTSPILESRFIYEYNFGEIPKGYEIHHKNLISNDDSIDNLELLSIKDHHKIHYPSYMLGDSNPMRRFPEKNIFNNSDFQKEIREKYHLGKKRSLETRKLIQEKVREKFKRKEELLNIYNDLRVILSKKPTYEEWRNEVILRGLDPSFKEDKYSSHKFRDFNEVEQRADLINHRVISVSSTGRFEDVYNGTVSDTHCYFIRNSKCSNKQDYVLVANCGELPLSPYDSCRLGHLNLYAYVEYPFSEKSTFNWIKFKKDVSLVQRIMDNVIDLEEIKIKEILNQIESSYDDEASKQTEKNLWNKILNSLTFGRRTGLGVMGEGDMLAALGFQYGSEDGNKFAIEVHRIMAIYSYMASIQLAKEKGSFPIWNRYKEKDNPFINRILEEIKKENINIYNDYFQYGRRNIANLTIAPTGTTGQIANKQGVSSGIEPVFEVFYKRRRKVNPNDKYSKIDFVDEVGDAWEEYYVFHPTFLDWYKYSGRGVIKRIEDLSNEEVKNLIKESPYYMSTANEVDVISKIHLQGGIQQWIDHSISVTHNLPKETTVEQVYNYYVEAWKSGCKGITIYRDGSRSGVLIREDEDNKPVNFSYTSAQERPSKVECEIHRLYSKGEYWYIIVELIGSKPYGIFAVKEDKLPSCLRISANTVLKGILIRESSKKYNLFVDRPDTGEKISVKDIVSLMETDDDRTDTKRFSLELRHRISPLEIAETIEKQPKEITSFEKAIARVLKKYITDGTKSGVKCQNCGSTNVIYASGCPLCLDCGDSKCG